MAQHLTIHVTPKNEQEAERLIRQWARGTNRVEHHKVRRAQMIAVKLGMAAAIYYVSFSGQVVPEEAPPGYALLFVFGAFAIADFLFELACNIPAVKALFYEEKTFDNHIPDADPLNPECPLCDTGLHAETVTTIRGDSNDTDTNLVCDQCDITWDDQGKHGYRHNL